MGLNIILVCASPLANASHNSQPGSTHEVVLLDLDNGDLHVVGGGAEFFKLLGSEDVDTDQMDLGVTVLASLGGGHVDDLAGTALDDDVAVLAEGRTLHREGVGGTSISLVVDLKLHDAKLLAS